MADPTAERWLAQLQESGELPVALIAVACQARRIAAGQATPETVARARVRTAAGRWLVLHATTLACPDATTTVVVGPAPMDEIAPLIASAYGLSPRERAVTRRARPGDHRDRRGAAPVAVDRPGPPEIDLRQGRGAQPGELVARLYFPADTPELTS